MQKKIALLHRYPKDRIKETNAAFPYIVKSRYTASIKYLEGSAIYFGSLVDVLTFKTFDRLNSFKKFWKSLAWIFYAPMLVIGKGYEVIYCDDSYPFYPILVKLVSPRSKVIIRIGDFHLMYYYSGVAYRILHFFEKLGWLCADRIVAISDAMADEIRKEINRPVSVVLDPVDPKDFEIKNQNPEGSVMFHGLLTKNKNVDILLEAARRLPAVDFVVVGDGPDLKRLQKMAPKNVFFDGWTPFKDMPRKIASCSVGVALRSDNPGNEYVVTSPYLQYGVMGKPCLVTRRKVFGDYPWQFSTVDEMVRLISILMKHKEAGKILQGEILKNHDAEKIGEEIWSLLQS